jgi:hypothetical protein
MLANSHVPWHGPVPFSHTTEKNRQNDQREFTGCHVKSTPHLPPHRAAPIATVQVKSNSPQSHMVHIMGYCAALSGKPTFEVGEFRVRPPCERPIDACMHFAVPSRHVQLRRLLNWLGAASFRKFRGPNPGVHFWPPGPSSPEQNPTTTKTRQGLHTLPLPWLIGLRFGDFFKRHGAAIA